MLIKEINKLDKIWKEKNKEDNDFKCEICGNDGEHCQLHSHHFIGRRVRSTRWLMVNGFCLCATHHTMGQQSAHEDPQWFIQTARALRGEKWYKGIEKIKSFKNKFDLETNLMLMDKSVEEIIEYYEQNS